MSMNLYNFISSKSEYRFCTTACVYFASVRCVQAWLTHNQYEHEFNKEESEVSAFYTSLFKEHFADNGVCFWQISGGITFSSYSFVLQISAEILIEYVRTGRCRNKTKSFVYQTWFLIISIHSFTCVCGNAHVRKNTAMTQTFTCAQFSSLHPRMQAYFGS